ncbi:MAG: Ig-like domain-containing protein [Comamonadaceae bacterium]|nr:Ig-like domain-containing protein [Comamonadaceae bacterium]
MLMTSITGTTTPMGLTIVFEDAPPVVDIVSPDEGQTVYGTVTVSVSASDDKGVARVELYGDGALLGTLAAAPYDFALDTTVFANGSRVLRAVAVDTIGTTSSAEVTVVAENIFAPASLKAVRVGQPQPDAQGIRRRPDLVGQLAQHERREIPGLPDFRGGRTLLGEVAKAASNTTYRYLDRGVARTGSYSYEVVGVNEGGREGVARGGHRQVAEDRGHVPEVHVPL